MAVHHGGKVGKAGKTLASKSSSKQSKSKAGTNAFYYHRQYEKLSLKSISVYSV